MGKPITLTFEKIFEVPYNWKTDEPFSLDVYMDKEDNTVVFQLTEYDSGYGDTWSLDLNKDEVVELIKALQNWVECSG